MTSGVDTTFLVELEIQEAEGHQRARDYLSRTVLDSGDSLALAPQVLAEFVHVVTDKRRFQHPLETEAALARADFWWRAEEVRQVYPDAAAVTLFLHWMHRYELGRKRILDTLLAATYVAAGVRRIITTDARDYGIYGELEVVRPGTGGQR